MKSISFVKYHGTGNDFVMIHDPDHTIDISPEVIQHICTRRFGVGSDGLILIQPSRECDFHMEFFNPDGSKSFCGNGSRCAVHFAYSLKLIGRSCSFSAIDGIHHAHITDTDVSVSMRDVQQQDIQQIGQDYWLYTGSPHLVRYVPELDAMDVQQLGREIRYSPKFAEKGVNVNFVQRLPNCLSVRTYERGVENETLSCGTGVTAVAIADHITHNGDNFRLIQTSGGKLKVAFEESQGVYSNVRLIGPAVPVFQGSYSYEEL